MAISIHALREEGDASDTGRKTKDGKFLSTPSARRATMHLSRGCGCLRISIHALREEGDARRGSGRDGEPHFYPRPPRGGRPVRNGFEAISELFLSTPSARRATADEAPEYDEDIFLSTPSARRATRAARSGRRPPDPFLSTPSARRATGLSVDPGNTSEFLSTPSARRATAARRLAPFSLSNFYPRPPRGGRRQHRAGMRGKNDFYPRPPRGGRPTKGASFLLPSRFLSTPSARRATTVCFSPNSSRLNFYPRPPRGGRRKYKDQIAARMRFLSTPSARRATRDRQEKGDLDGISIHALREEGDLRDFQRIGGFSVFLSTPSARRATHSHFLPLNSLRFLSTPSARRATVRLKKGMAPQPISIHALREEGDPSGAVLHFDSQKISIHALREEGDRCEEVTLPWIIYFYPRPPRGGRLLEVSVDWLLGKISIHALREEGDRSAPPGGFHPADFYPRPPRGGRRMTCARQACTTLFLSTPSARRATLHTKPRPLCGLNFYPRPPRGGRRGPVRRYKQT